jgi:sugar lactone lactonase YvrE
MRAQSRGWACNISHTFKLLVAFFAAAPCCALAQSYRFTTVAGSNANGLVDGTGSQAVFRYLTGMAIDASGNIFVADAPSNAIRKVTPAGAVTTFAGGALLPGLVDGQGTAARFAYPTGVAVDGAGNIYVSDSGNNAIRKISPAGAVTTLAGGGKGVFIPGTNILDPGYYDNSGSADGTGRNASFDMPSGVAVDGAGNVFVADTFNNEIRKVTPGGVVSTVAGSPLYESFTNNDGVGADARFYGPIGVATDPNGNLIVADTDNSSIRRVTPGGVVTTVAGPRIYSAGNDTGAKDGPAADALFRYPAGIACDSAGNIFVGDTQNSSIRRISTTGTVTTIGGIPGKAGEADGDGSGALFNGPYGLALAPDGSLFVSDSPYIRKGVPLPAGTPAILLQPVGTTLVAGQSFALIFGSAGNNPTYQWLRNGITIPGATAASYSVATVTSADSGSYQVVVTNQFGSATSFPAIVVVTPSTFSASPSTLDSSRLIDISTRSYVGLGSAVSIAGFVVEGNKPKTLLIRAAGPSLAQFGVSGVLDDPVLELHSSTSIVGTNDNWSDDPTEATFIANAAKIAGAWSWQDGSQDSAMVVTLNPGSYTAIVSGRYGFETGVALVEVYDVDYGPGAARLTNLSTRSQVQGGQQVQIAGFVIAGPSPKKVLIRASGPALAKYGVSGLLADPYLEVHAASGLLASNDNWDVALRPSFQAMGVDNWSVGSADAALEMTLDPGTYTAVVSGKGGATGVNLVEILEEN